MKIRHLLGSSGLDLAEIAQRVSGSLGYRVGAVSREPTADDPGVIIFVCQVTGDHIPVDPRIVVNVINELVAERDHPKLGVLVAAPVPPKSSERQALDEFDAASAPAGKLLALRNYIARIAAADEEARIRAAQGA